MTGPGIAVDLPEGWRHRNDIAPFALYAQADPWSDGFVPNLTVAVTSAAEGEAPESYLARQLEGMAAQLSDPLLIDAAVDRSGGTVSLLIAHATTGVDLTMAQHHRFTGDGFVIAAAATAADADWPAVAVDLLALVRSVRAHP